MRSHLVRIAVAAVVAAAGALVVTSDAMAQTVTSGSLSFSGTPGDWISQGNSYSYATTAGDTFTVTSSAGNNHVEVAVSNAAGHWWYLDLAAPSGQPLAAGTYSNAYRYPFQAATQPGLALDGDGRGCNVDTGSFAVQQAVFGPNGYVQEFDATFTQYCDSTTTYSTGSVHVGNAPPPPTLTVGATVAANATAGKRTGALSVSGTVSCNVAATVTVSGSAREVLRKAIAQGTFSTTVACAPGRAAAWSASVAPTGNTPFDSGSADVSAQASATDPNWGGTVTASASQSVKVKAV